MILSDDEAKAAQEVAKAANKAIDAVVGAGSVLVNSTVGRIAAATLRFVGGDWIEEQQKRNLARMQAKTARKLDGVAQDRLSEPSPSVVKPLLEAAADESREELQDLWAALLANAMVDGGRRVRRSFFDVVRQLEPEDAIVLRIINEVACAHASDEWGPFDEGEAEDMEVEVRDKASAAGLDRLLLGLSLDHLDRLSLISGTSLCAHPTNLGQSLLGAMERPE